MTRINETPKWEGDIYQIVRLDKVEGGRDGVINLQAGQLANRTLFLKGKIDSLSDAIFSVSGIYETKEAGLLKTVTGEYFKVPAVGVSSVSYILYQNKLGVAVEILREASPYSSGYQAAKAVSSSAANAIAITIPGLLTDGALIYFVSPITNTGATTVVITDANGNSYTRTIYTGPNSPLSAGDLMTNNPAIIEYRSSPTGIFTLVVSGPAASTLNTRLSKLEPVAWGKLTSVAGDGTAYTATADVTSGGLYIFPPNTPNTTNTPTLSINGGTARVIKHANGGALEPRALDTGRCLIMYDSVSQSYLLLSTPAYRSRILSAYRKATVTSGTDSPNDISLTINGSLGDGTQLTFEPVVANTGPVRLVVTDVFGNTQTRALVKGPNTPLAGGELIANQPVTVQFRGSPTSNFKLITAGDPRTDIMTLKSDVAGVKAGVWGKLTGVAGDGTAYTATADVTTGGLYVFPPNTPNTTNTPTLRINGGTARVIKHANGAALEPGALSTGRCLIMYDSVSQSYLLLSTPAYRGRILAAYSGVTVTSGTDSPNDISLTITGSLGAGTTLTFEPVVANTGPVRLVVTDAFGNTQTRALVKGPNTPLAGGELIANQPAVVKWRGSPQTNFKLITAGDPRTDIMTLQDGLTALKNSFGDPYSALAAKLVGVTGSNSIFGDITWNNGVKTVAKKPIICTSIGSSVGTGAGSGNNAVYAPNALFVAALKAELDMYGSFDIIDDNQCIPTQAFQQFSAQLDNSPYTTSDFVLIVGGMNDGPVGNFNTGLTYPGQRAALESLIDKCLARGAIPIVCTTPHHDVTSASTYPSVPAGISLGFQSRTYNVSVPYAFNADDRTITHWAFANSGYGGNIMKAGSTINVGSGVNAGNYTIESFSEDRTKITVVEAIPETSTYTTTIRHSNLNAIAEDVLDPPPSKSRVTKDWTGSGVLTTGDVRFGIVNNMMRSVARQKGAFLADCEYSWFKYGIEVGGYSSVYSSGNYNHPNANGYTVSYGYTLKVAAREIARLIFGEKYYAKA